MFRSYAPFIFGVTDGVVGAAEGAFTGAVGAAVLSALGVECDAVEAAKIAALGKSMLAAALAARSKKLVTCGFFHKASNKLFSFSNAFLVSSYTGLQVVSGVLGNMIFQFVNNTDGSQEEVMKIMALGAVVTLVPVWLIDSYLYHKISPKLTRFGKTLKLLDWLQHEEDDEAPASSLGHRLR